MGLETYKKTTNKQRKESEQKFEYVCYICRAPGGTFYVEKDNDGKKVRAQDGRDLYYHLDCKIKVLNNMVKNKQLNIEDLNTLSTIPDNY